MATVDTVVPNSLNYTDIKPQCIESEIKLCKYQPTSVVTGAKPSDTVKFLLSGHGLLDPYSTFLKFTVKCDIPLPAKGGTNGAQYREFRFLDRSAHSFISRIIIRSQGVELERIQDYDIVAAMINDMIYAPDQHSLHSWEGFPTQQIQLLKDRAPKGVGNDTIRYAASSENRDALFRLMNQGASPVISPSVGEVCFMNVLDPGILNGQTSEEVKYEEDDDFFDPEDPFNMGIEKKFTGSLDQLYAMDTYILRQKYLGKPLPDESLAATFTGNIMAMTPTSFAFHENGLRIPATMNSADKKRILFNGTDTMTFCIPIYSGVIGLLMPEKKLIPLSLLPIEIEITFNQYALYSMGRDEIVQRKKEGEAIIYTVGGIPGNPGSRDYTITDFNLYANTLFFEQEIHKTLENSVAQHGLFLYCNSFHQAPTQLLTTQSIPTVSHIALNLKSVNSVHCLFTYTGYEQAPFARKLHFVSHNLTSLQLMNGTQLIPMYAIEGHSGTSRAGQHIPFLMELLKAWNKQSDPASECLIQPYNFCEDGISAQYSGFISEAEDDVSARRALATLVNKQSLVGRCQYAISLEGEELGTERTMITGRKIQYPFLLQMKSTGKTIASTSYMYTFLRADFVVYIRPDLQIVTLGK